MGTDNVSDKVNINVGDTGRGGGSDAAMAAVIAAMNSGGGNDALAGIIAAQNRPDPMASLGPVLAMMGSRRDEGFGGGIAGILALLALLRRGGLGDGEGCAPRNWDGGLSPGQAAALQTLMEGQSALRAEGPENTLRAQGEILQAISALQLGAQQGFASTGDKIQSGLLAELAAIASAKDTTQNGFALTGRDLATVNQNVSAQGCQTREAVQNDGDKTRALLVQRFTLEDQTKINELNARVIELQSEGRRRADHDDLRIQISNTNTAVAAQAQAQGQFQVQTLREDVGRLHDEVRGVFQVAQAASNQTSIIAGNLGAVVGGAQTATQTPINNKT